MPSIHLRSLHVEQLAQRLPAPAPSYFPYGHYPSSRDSYTLPMAQALVTIFLNVKHFVCGSFTGRVVIVAREMTYGI